MISVTPDFLFSFHQSHLQLLLCFFESIAATLVQKHCDALGDADVYV